MAKYDEVVIDYVYQNTDGSYSTAKLPKNESRTLAGFSSFMAFRQATATNTGVAFDSGSYAASYGNSGRATLNEAIIPLRIYGLKINQA